MANQRLPVTFNMEEQQRYKDLKTGTKFSAKLHTILADYCEKEEFKRGIKRPA